MLDGGAPIQAADRSTSSELPTTTRREGRNRPPRAATPSNIGTPPNPSTPRTCRGFVPLGALSANVSRLPTRPPITSPGHEPPTLTPSSRRATLAAGFSGARASERRREPYVSRSSDATSLLDKHLRNHRQSDPHPGLSSVLWGAGRRSRQTLFETTRARHAHCASPAPVLTPEGSAGWGNQHPP